MKFSNLSVRYKLWSLILLAATALIVLTVMALVEMRASLYAERELQLKVLIDSAYSVLEEQETRVNSGQITAEEARSEARTLLENMTYGEDGYFFVVDRSATMVVHGGNRSLVGKDMSRTRTSSGQLLFSDMAALIGSGKNTALFRYDWPHAGKTEPQPKLSYARAFNPWGWVIGSGVYIDDLNETLSDNLIQLVVQLVIALALMAGVAAVIGRSIIEPLERIHDVMERVAGGDLKVRTEVSSHDEFGRVSGRIDSTLEVFQGLIREITNSTNQLTSNAEELSSSAKETSGALDRQAQESELLSAAMTEMTASIEEVARSAGETSMAIENADQEADDGNRDVDSSIAKIQELAAEVEEAAAVIKDLEKDTEQISNVLSHIQKISDQTNLLALNAAIEAARAGETGRGFAVVADEVRELARHSRDSTEEIQSLNERLSKAARKAVDVMDRSRQRAEDSVNAAKHAGDKLSLIVTDMSRVRDMGLQVAAATEQQSLVSEEMNGNLMTITKGAETTVEAAKTVSASGERLKHLASNLQSEISRFRI